MKSIIKQILIIVLLSIAFNPNLQAQNTEDINVTIKSPWGPDDQIGTLNMMTQKSKLKILSRISSGKVYDLSFEYFMGMPDLLSLGLGDPSYQIWMTHTPKGTVVDNPNEAGKKVNKRVSYTGEALMMPTHTGTHIDALCHFGLYGKIWNGFRAQKYLGDNGWHKAGAENIPPIIARGVLIDVASLKGVKALSKGYRISTHDLKAALRSQNVTLKKGDVVLIRTGYGSYFDNKERYLNNYPGVSFDAIKWLVEKHDIILLGIDNLSLEAFPSMQEDNWIPIHTYLLAEQGMMFIENVNLEQLAEDQVYKFAFIAAPLKIRGACGAPIRPLAIPIK